MAKKISQQLWIKRKEADKFFFNAKAYGYRARSVYKLLEINKKFNILRENISVADLGAAPGSWSQMLAEILFKKNENSKSKVYAIDIEDMKPIERVVILKKNIYELYFFYCSSSFWDSTIIKIFIYGQSSFHSGRPQYRDI